MPRAVSILPVVVRELRVAARKRQTYWGRVMFPMVAVAICTITLWGVLFLDAAQGDGRALFQALTVFAFIAMAMSGMTAADVITSEKREGTLGLLFLTHLKGYDVALGKVAPVGLMTFYGLIAAFPVLAIPMMLGGITLTEFVQVSVALIIINLFSLSIGLLVSTLCRDVARAYVTLLITLPTVGFGIAYLLLKSPLHDIAPKAATFLALFAPQHLFDLASGSAAAGARNSFHESALAHLFATVVILTIACRAAPRSWHEPAVLKPSPGWAMRLNEWRYGNQQWRARFRQRIFRTNPIFWLRSRDRITNAILLIATIGSIALWVASWVGQLLPGAPGFRPLGGLVMAFLAASVLLLFMTLGAFGLGGQALAEDRKSGALELITASPLTVDSILRGHWLAMARAAAPYGLAAACSTTLVVFGFLTVAQIESADYRSPWQLFLGAIRNWLNGERVANPESLAVAFFAFLACLPLVFATLGWATLWSAMRVQKSSNAFAQGIFVTLGMPWPITVSVLGIADYGRRHWNWILPDNNIFTTLLFFAVLTVNGLLVTLLTRHAVRKHFREWAAERQSGDGPEWWRNIWNGLKALAPKRREAPVHRKEIA